VKFAFAALALLLLVGLTIFFAGISVLTACFVGAIGFVGLVAWTAFSD
jgi:hypothetical protein